MAKPEFVLDGHDFSTLEEFYQEFTRVVIPGIWWLQDLDGFNSILYGEEGMPRDGYILRWTSVKVSRDRLGYQETVRQLERRLARCHPLNISLVQQKLNLARQGMGETFFDWLIDILRSHAPGKPKKGKNTYAVELILQ